MNKDLAMYNLCWLHKQYKEAKTFYSLVNTNLGKPVNIYLGKQWCKQPFYHQKPTFTVFISLTTDVEKERQLCLINYHPPLHPTPPPTPKKKEKKGKIHIL